MALYKTDEIKAPNWDAIPENMKQAPHWLLWRAEQDRKHADKLTKVPKDITGGSLNGWQNATSLYSFDQVRQAFDSGQFSGVGFAPQGTPFVSVDLDNPNGIHDISDTLKAITAKGFAEVSPSGRGLHVWMMGEVPAEAGRKRKTDTGEEIEFFTNSGWVTVTGDVYPGGIPEPTNQQPAINKILKRFNFLPQPTETPKQTNNPIPAPMPASSSNMNDSEVLNLMLSSAAGPAIRDLLNNNTGNGDASSNDLALMNYAAFFTGKDAQMMDTIMRISALYRDKWDQKHASNGATYGQMTIAKAIADTHQVYDPQRGVTAPSYQPQQQELSPSAIAKMQEELEGMLDTHTINDIPAKYKDIATPEQLERLYINTSPKHQLQNFLNGVRDSINMPSIASGFAELDKVLGGGFYPGLYIMGAISSLGKTTLALQIADNVAQAGNDVIIFSMEMSRNELMAKTLSRLTFIQTVEEGKESKYAKTVRGITEGKRYPFYSDYEKKLIMDAANSYNEYAGNIFIHEGLGDIGVTELRTTVEAHIARTGKAPFVMIDYLQILAPYDPRSTDKQNTDKAVLELKRLSRDSGIPVLAISSFNRENYSQSVSMVSFKESGAIEYSSDVLIGLQFRKQRDIDAWNKDNPKKKKALDHDHEKRKEPREIELKILKNRNGATGGSADFDYYAKFNYYQEADIQPSDAKALLEAESDFFGAEELEGAKTF